LKLYEYQAKEIFCANGITIPQGEIVSSVEEAAEIADKFENGVVIKSQVHVGGRGKAGGIKFASKKSEIKKFADELLNKEIKGEKTKNLLIESQKNIKQELYLGITLNRNKKTDTLIFSSSGGVEIEKVAEDDPEKVIKVDIDPVLGLQNFHLIPVASACNFKKNITSKLFSYAKKLYDIYKKYDCMMVEINPLAYLTDESLIALDGKLEMDDNAGYRQPELMEKWDKEKEDPVELIGKKEGFVVIKLSGDISIISNGAGLAISTLDSLQRHNRSAANILDLGGGATSEKVQKAVNVILHDDDVRAILFNIFGGITRCNEIAKGVVNAIDGLPNNIPVVCRLQGTNKEKGIEILNKAGLEAAVDLDQVVGKVVEKT